MTVHINRKTANLGGWILLALGLLAVLVALLADVISGDSFRLSVKQIALLSVGVLLVILGVALVRGKKDLSISLVNDLLMVLSIAFTAILIEVAANLYLNNVASRDVFNRYASVNQLQDRYGGNYITATNLTKWTPHEYLGYIPTPDFRDGPNRHNALGYRGDEITLPKPDGTYRIVCLGGSTTYSTKVDDYHQSYPYLVQQNLRQAGFSNVEVINAGASGYSSWESMISLELRVLDLDPDMIIVYHGVNDVSPRLVWPPSAYRGDNSGSVVPRPQAVTMPPVWQYSTALRMLMIELGEIEPHSTLDYHFKYQPETAYEDLFIEQVREGTYPDGIFEEVSAAQMFESNPPIYFERNIRNMIAVAHDHDIDVVLVTFAFSPLFESPRVSTEEFQQAREENNQVLVQVAADTGVYLYDFAEEMPDDEIYFTDGDHFTVEGNQLRAELFTRFLQDIVPQS